MDTNSPNPNSAAQPANSPAPSAAAASPVPAAKVAPAAAPAAKPAAPAVPPPPPPPVPSGLAGLQLPFEGVDFGYRGIHAEAKVSAEQVVEAAKAFDKAGFAIDTITGVDWMAEGQMEVIYDYYHPDKNLRAAVRARIPREKPEIPTISSVFPGANWHERETHDFFGIVFTGHPNLEPFLLPEDAAYHPLRKDFTSCS